VRTNGTPAIIEVVTPVSPVAGTKLSAAFTSFIVKLEAEKNIAAASAPDKTFRANPFFKTIPPGANRIELFYHETKQA